MVDPDDAVAVMRAAGLTPLEPYSGSLESWRSRCENCGNEVNPRYNSVAQRGTGCKYCAAHGFKPALASVLYLMEISDPAALKVGITNFDSTGDRIGQHETHGWELVEIWDFVSGEQAQIIEKRVLAWWRQDLQAPAALEEWQLPQGGCTETASLELVGLQETIEFINEAISSTLGE